MAVTLEQLLATPMPEKVFTYTEKDLILYALGIGLGEDPLNESQLRFVYEKNLLPLPTAAIVLPYVRVSDLNLGLNYLKLVHGDQALTVHKLPPVAGTVVAKSSLAGVLDKGADKGAIVLLRRQVFDQASGDLLATIDTGLFARGDGGIGSSIQEAPPLAAIPERAADLTCDLAISPRAALIYRLSGDVNALHADPAVAKKAGFERPILHGLATYGVIGHAVLQQVCDYDPARLKSLKGRFSAPVYPGETIQVSLWRENGGVAIRGTVAARNAVVFNNGFAEVA